MSSEFAFACEQVPGAWDTLDVVEIAGEEGMSRLYRYDVHVLSADDTLEPSTLLGARATLRLTTHGTPAFRHLHGIITEVEDLQQTADGDLLRVQLMPPLARAMHRRRCRMFVDKTLRQIVEAVLLGDPQMSRVDGAAPPREERDDLYRAAEERFTWRIIDPSRIDAVHARPSCVQYNESDLAFLSRLLEDEGIAYSFECGAEECLLVLSDHDGALARLAPYEELGPGLETRVLRDARAGVRMRAQRVALSDYSYHNPALDLAVASPAAPGDGGLGSEEYPGGFTTREMAEPLVRARAERLRTESAEVRAEGTTRLLSAGTRFPFVPERARLRGDYLVTGLTARGRSPRWAQGSEGEPFVCRVQCLRATADDHASFRPARATPRPRIVGSQTAVVTAEHGSEAAVNVGEGIGSVRLRFHWDRDAARLAREPSSGWVRVSHLYAGSGEGAVWHPRVGNEVVVEFLDGDPDRPIVTGRVYNATARPPVPADGAATQSAFRTLSVPGGAGYNELSFDDAAGAERLSIHAARDYLTVVEGDADVKVAGDASELTVGSHESQVDGDRSALVRGVDTLEIGGDRREHVKGDTVRQVDGGESVTVQASRSVHVGADAHHAVDGNETLTVGAHHRLEVGKNSACLIGGARALQVDGDDSAVVSGAQKTHVGKDAKIQVDGNASHAIDGMLDIHVGGDATSAVSGTARTKANRIVVSAEQSWHVTAPAAKVQAEDHVTLEVGRSRLRVLHDRVEIEGPDGAKVVIQDGRIRHNC